MERFLFALKLCSVLGCGLIAGVFFAFSVFVMRALAKLPTPQGIVAMQHINVTVLNPVFLGVFMGTAAACLALGVTSVGKWQQPGTMLLMVGSLCYLVGTFGVTVACNVPLNDALAAVKPGSEEGARVWASYLTTWTMWNHVRTVAALIATASFTLSLYHEAKGR